MVEQSFIVSGNSTIGSTSDSADAVPYAKDSKKSVKDVIDDLTITYFGSDTPSELNPDKIFISLGEGSEESMTLPAYLSDISSKLNGLIKTKIYKYEYTAVTATLGGRAVSSPAINVSMDGYTPILASLENSDTAYINASCLLTGTTLYIRGYASATNVPAGSVSATIMYVKNA